VRSRLTALLAAATLMAAAACGSRARPPRVQPDVPPAVAPTAPLRVLVGGAVRSIAVEEYVAGCVAAELGAPGAGEAAARRARQLQAILCRSYANASRHRHRAAGFDLCSTTHCQLYRPAPAAGTGRLARDAAADTKGLVLLFDGRPVRPLYHSSCGGRTSAARDVWPGDGSPWLGSVADDRCRREPAWHFAVEIDRLGRGLASDGRLRLSLPLREVEVAARDGAGRAASIRLVGRATITVRGDEFRAAVMRIYGPRSLASTLFSIQRSGGRLVFEGRGSGHGVGLCQAGALRLAQSGEGPAAILRRYFPGTTLGRPD
jgi:stage II sporulation protein D